jgi:D-glycero-D-manno-heptose 1,7-bisphosphate phosphatase
MGIPEMNKAVFLDRDGVINKVVLREGKACSPRTSDEFEFVENIGDDIKRLKSASFIVIVVSNQPDIARGRMDIAELEKMNERIRDNLPVDDILFCPHDDNDECDCRKPQPGMILYAFQKYKIDSCRSYLVGDREKDMEAARNAGCEGILIDTLYNRDVRSVTRVQSVREAVNIILNEKEKF